MSGSERRRSQRIRFTGKATLHYDHNQVMEAEVDTHDISLHGLFLKTAERIPLTTPCEIEICVSGMTSSMGFRARGVIQRHDPVGMAVTFTCLEPDSCLHILNLVRLHEAE